MLSALDGWRIMVQITIYYYVHDIVYISKFHTITFGVLVDVAKPRGRSP